jgi:hypothetical protein
MDHLRLPNRIWPSKRYLFYHQAGISARAEVVMCIYWTTEGTYKSLAWQAYGFFCQELSWESSVPEFEEASDELRATLHRGADRALIII